MKKLLKKQWFRMTVALPLTVGVITIIGIIAVQKEVEKKWDKDYKDKQEIKQEGWEIGYFQGQIDGYQAKEDEQWDALSPNPNLVELLRKYFPEYRIARTIRAIATAESSGKGFAINQNDNGSLDCGWLQNNSIHKKPGETNKQYCDRMHDLEENIKQARATYDKQGFEAWVTYKTGAYKKYLPN